MARSLDELAPNFRRACDLWPDAALLAGHYDAVKQGFESGGHGAVATVKSFLESVCVTVLTDFGLSLPSPQPSTRELLAAALQPLGLQNTRGASKLDKLVSAHNKLCDALNEMRNDNDPTAHGKDGFLDRITGVETQSFLHTGDAIVGLILAAYEGTDPDLRYTREPYERFIHLHERIDQAIAVTARVETDEDDKQVIVVELEQPTSDEQIELRFEPSKLLFAVDRTAYLEVLATSRRPLPSTVPAETVDLLSALPTLVEPVEPNVFEAPSRAKPTETPTLVNAYAGRLKHLLPGLNGLLTDAKSRFPVSADPTSDVASSILRLVDSDIGLDWEIREPLRAKLRVLIKRVLVSAGMSSQQAKGLTIVVEEWLVQQRIVPEVSGAQG